MTILDGDLVDRLRRTIDLRTTQLRHTESFVAALLAERARTFRPCAFCGAPARGPACAEHADLVGLDGELVKAIPGQEV